jgi:regulator of protease activity HflC (stomatin/prohibitin superfamily)
MVIAAAALVVFAAIIIQKQRERAEAERMMPWG